MDGGAVMSIVYAAPFPLGVKGGESELGRETAICVKPGPLFLGSEAGAFCANVKMRKLDSSQAGGNKAGRRGSRGHGQL